MTRSAFVWMMAAAVSMGLMGCGSAKSGRQSVYKAKGKVTFAGGTVPNASVIFAPKAKQPVATGRTNEAGEFVLTTYDSGDGAAAGEFVVLVLKDEPNQAQVENTVGGHDPNSKTSPDGAKMHAAEQAKKAAGGGSGIPAKYSRVSESPLSAKIEAGGSNDFTFDLTP